jgi:hypothetical protein
MQMHMRHTAEVSQFFKGHGEDRLLVAPLASPDTAAAIAGFLGYDPHDAVMPRKRGRKKKRTLDLKLLALAAPVLRVRTWGQDNKYYRGR